MSILIISRKESQLKFVQTIVDELSENLCGQKYVSSGPIGKHSLIFVDATCAQNLKDIGLLRGQNTNRRAGAKTPVRIIFFADYESGQILLGSHPDLVTGLLFGAPSAGRRSRSDFARLLADGRSARINSAPSGGMSKESIHVLKCIGDKEIALQLLSEELRKRCSNLRMRNRIITSADEMLMNAIFHAPTKAGIHQFRLAPRDRDVLSETKPVTIAWSDFGTSFTSTVIDQYGSLDKRKLLKSIVDAKREFSRVAADNPSAGVGLANVLKAGGSLFIAYVPKIRCEVSAIFDLGGAAKKVEPFAYLILLESGT